MKGALETSKMKKIVPKILQDDPVRDHITTVHMNAHQVKGRSCSNLEHCKMLTLPERVLIV